jgi:flagellar hook assembly protein FlgD
MEKGEHNVEWTAKDSRGKNLPGGMYIARVQTGNTVSIKRMMLIQ